MKEKIVKIMNYGSASTGGWLLEGDDEEDTCNQCGYSVDTDDNYCSNCGQKIEDYL